MEAWSSFQRCHMNPHVWDLPYVWYNSLTCIQPWGAMCFCACSTARGTRGNVTSKPWKPLFGNSTHPPLQPWWSRAPCSCAITIPHGSISHSPYGVALSYIFISISILPVFSPLQYQAVLRPSGFAHLAGVCSLSCLLELLP